MKLSDIGEKRLISDYIRPLFNPKASAEGVGDDCALIPVHGDICVCVSTDRVPADLVSFRLGLITFRELGQYLAVLNISDIAAAGGEPRALFLNLAFPSTFALADFEQILCGVNNASLHYGVDVLGGDLSDSQEMNLVATVVGIVRRDQALLRSGARPGQKVFCTDAIGVTPAAFAHYLDAGDRPHLQLTSEMREVITAPFRHPIARVALGRKLSSSMCCTSAMDVTDGVSQSFTEIGASSGVGIVLDVASLPIHPVCREIASYYCIDAVNLALDPGADFQLVGTVDTSHPGYDRIAEEIHLIGEVVEGSGTFLRWPNGEIKPMISRGWNYYV